jgi:hypothetical protein
MISSPGGIFDAFIEDVTNAMTAAANDGPAAGFKEIAAKYGIEFLA